jgi:hypothetical protein
VTETAANDDEAEGGATFENKKQKVGKKKKLLYRNLCTLKN